MKNVVSFLCWYNSYMRVKFNSLAHELLKKSDYVIHNFPITINSKTIIELGMGKGTMISKLAIKHPDKRFIGIEKNETIANKAVELFELHKINNLQIAVQDIKDIADLFKGKTSEIYITFPDPWPKNRHEKRRLTYKSFLLLYKKLLTDDGVIKFKSDNDKLYEYTLESFVENNMKIIYTTKDLHNSKYMDNNETTDYENKWSKQGKNINYIEASF